MVNKNNNKGISPVVATALLLVVAVVAVVGFQTWFNTYQSGLNAKVEQQSDTGSSITVERIEINSSDTGGVVYLKNSGTTAITGITVKVTPKSSTDSASCTETTMAVGGSSVNQTTLACTGMTAGNIYNVVAVTNDGVFSGEQIAR